MRGKVWLVRQRVDSGRESRVVGYVRPFSLAACILVSMYVTEERKQYSPGLWLSEQCGSLPWREPDGFCIRTKLPLQPNRTAEHLMNKE